MDPADIPNSDLPADEEEEQATIIGASRCFRDGTPNMPYLGEDTAERMLLREGIIDEIPPKLCDADRANKTKNVILVVGDGMGWEMVRAGESVDMFP